MIILFFGGYKETDKKKYSMWKIKIKLFKNNHECLLDEWISYKEL